jgi:hypothetical protein
MQHAHAVSKSGHVLCFKLLSSQKPKSCRSFTKHEDGKPSSCPRPWWFSLAYMKEA